MTRPKKKSDLLQGTLDLLVLKILSAGSLHGYGLAARIHQLSDEVLRIEEGSLYPALYRLELKGIIESDWRLTDSGREAKFYKLTRKGRRQMKTEADGWARSSAAVERVLRAIEQGG